MELDQFAHLQRLHDLNPWPAPYYRIESRRISPRTDKRVAGLAPPGDRIACNDYLSPANCETHGRNND